MHLSPIGEIFAQPASARRTLTTFPKVSRRARNGRLRRLAMTLLLLLLTPGLASAATDSFPITHDAQVRQNKANNNYGDSNNLSATWAFWILKYYRHRDVRLMNGGRRKWIAESRPLSTTVPSPTPKKYRAGVPDQTLRATKEYIVSNLRKPSLRLMDTRTYEEYAGLRSRSVQQRSPPGP